MLLQSLNPTGLSFTPESPDKVKSKPVQWEHTIKLEKSGTGLPILNGLVDQIKRVKLRQQVTIRIGP